MRAHENLTYAVSDCFCIDCKAFRGLNAHLEDSPFGKPVVIEGEITGKNLVSEAAVDDIADRAENEIINSIEFVGISEKIHPTNCTCDECLSEQTVPFLILTQDEELSKEDSLIILKLESMYPQTMEQFKSMLLEEYLTFARKQFDYGPGNISVGQDLKNDDEILISLSGLFYRMNDKIQRIFNIVLKRRTLEATNESLADAYLDLSVYGKIARLVLKGVWGK